MLTYTAEHNPCLTPFVQKALNVGGKADSKQLEKLKVIFSDSLNSSDHLIVNISKAEEFYYSFSVIICSIRKTAQFLGKRLTIVGKAVDFLASAYECAFLSQNIGASSSWTLPVIYGKAAPG